MQRKEFVITIKDPRKDGAEWTPDDVETALNTSYCVHRDRGVIFKVAPLQTQLKLDL